MDWIEGSWKVTVGLSWEGTERPQNGLNRVGKVLKGHRLNWVGLGRFWKAAEWVVSGRQGPGRSQNGSTDPLSPPAPPGRLLKCLKGIAGSVRGLQCHPSLPLVASCGLDRFLRLHNLDDKRLLHKVGTPPPKKGGLCLPPEGSESPTLAQGCQKWAS